MATDPNSTSVVSTCRRADVLSPKALAAKLIDHERKCRSVVFANIYEDRILPMAREAVSFMALAHRGSLGVVHCPGTSIVERMSEDTYNRLHRRGIDD